MPRILSVLSLAFLAVAGSSLTSLSASVPLSVSVSVSASPALSRTNKLLNEINSVRIHTLEQQVEQLAQSLEQVSSKIDLSGDEKPARGIKSKDCPMARLMSVESNDSQEEDLPSDHPSVASIDSVFTSATHDDTGLGSDKASSVWDKILSNRTPGSFPSGFGLLKLFLESMDVTMDTVDDVFPPSRTKLIHSVGSHALGTLTWDKKLPYTGLFQSGASNMVIRLSSAKDPDNSAVIAGVSLKVFRDNIPSANSFFLHNFQSKSWNFFNDILQNHVSSVMGFLDPAKALAKKFQEASKYAFYTGLSDWAKFDEKGQVTPDNQIKFPFQVILVPNADLKSAGELIKPDGKVFTNQFNAIQPGTQLYTVFIQDEPFSTPYSAGKLKLNGDETGRLTTSSYGDNTLFFRHQRFDEDFVFRPDWKNTCPKPESCEYMYNPNSVTGK